MLESWEKVARRCASWGDAAIRSNGGGHTDDDGAVGLAFPGLITRYMSVRVIMRQKGPYVSRSFLSVRR